MKAPALPDTQYGSPCEAAGLLAILVYSREH